MRIGMTLSYTGGFAETVDELADFERAGLDIVFVAELYGFDGLSLMGFLAAVTERVQIGSAILPFYSRSPALLAMTAAGVDALSGGRCILGIGASGPQVIEGFHGVPFDSPVGRTEELIDICRAIWRREPLEHDGRHYQIPLPEDQGLGLGKPLKLIDHPVRASIPIFVAASGPKNVQIAAERGRRLAADLLPAGTVGAGLGTAAGSRAARSRSVPPAAGSRGERVGGDRRRPERPA